jgi:hypothetical protein
MWRCLNFADNFEPVQESAGVPIGRETRTTPVLDGTISSLPW